MGKMDDIKLSVVGLNGKKLLNAFRFQELELADLKLIIKQVNP